MADDEPLPHDNDDSPTGQDLPEEVLENLEEVAPLPAPVPEPGPLLPK
ncbi:hypothetical protein [Pseudomonas sp. Gutcm_11s]|nr:hypothetical protein [Pseudomonas sp. Gutcm_11s]MDD0842814.1 hypothetical protein [Pseudomonas sp. Gutcm_11s]